MNNLAIVLGVSKYIDERNNLPGCKNDADAMHKLLQKTEKFSSILYLNENEISSKVKEQLTNFIAENKGKPTDEVFIYYTGHGEFLNNEFYYLLSDFNPQKRNQTSLQNSEVDNLIRTLAPNIYVKVIDACQSGTAYIKENNAIAKYLDESKKGFKKCYFLNSSLNTQYSYQNAAISHFTFSFLRSIKEHTTDEIRYKDIIDVISDNFSTNQEQTPFFVIQADLTEKFCFISKGLKEFLYSLTRDLGEINTDKLITSKEPNLYELIKSDAKDYVDKDGALKALDFVKEEFGKFSLSTELDLIYDPSIEFLENYQNVPGLKAVTNWVDDNKGDYFASLIYVEKTDSFGSEYTDTEFELKVDVPYKGISIDLNKKLPNVSSYNCRIIFLLSRKSLRYFYFISTYMEESWDSRQLDVTKIKWKTGEAKISDEESIRKSLNRIKSTFKSKIEADLKEKFMPQKTESNEAQGPDNPEEKKKV